MLERIPRSTSQKKKPSTALYVVSSREGAPKNAAGVISPASPGLRLAERLRAARGEKGFSLETACQKSQVALRYVRMFEEGRYPMVADPAYLTHFVRRYAASLGLDELAASRELIAETERSPSPLHADAEPSTADRRDPAANANHAPGSGISQLMNRRMPKLGRNAWSGLPTFRGRGRSRPRIFKFYVGPLALIVAVAIVALSSLSYLGRDETPLSVPKATSALEGSSAMPTEATAAPSHEPDRIAASAAIPSLPPAADVSRPSVDASVPAAVNVAVRDSAAPQGLPHQPTGLPRVPPTQSSTNKASDTLRAEQLARMRAASAAE